MTTVYIVTEDSYSSYVILAIFSSMDNALSYIMNKYRKELKKHEAFINEQQTILKDQKELDKLSNEQYMYIYRGVKKRIQENIEYSQSQIRQLQKNIEQKILDNYDIEEYELDKEIMEQEVK